ncbi:hypothetical protein PN498_18240 [Oscillatoria sp. CS-180]|uniref:hypothetical protein n=1 Tax=Oscillatoria sp. CS-180 TaxID=3021720 RepID=UPI00232C3C15|nr:hypothetical protein [Oscillatoria sp. CS-180]MDB9527939.1 hypothetical protein [Oscillatoria sp. CS-180]
MWEIQHLSESGYTFKNAYDRQSLLQPDKWYSIVDGDRFFFTKPDNWLYFSTHSDDTLEVEREAIPVEEKTINLDEEVNRYQLQQKAQAQLKNPDNSLSFLTAVLKALWIGPLETDSPLWFKAGWQMFIVLVAAGIFAVFGIEKIASLLIKLIL